MMKNNSNILMIVLIVLLVLLLLGGLGMGSFGGYGMMGGYNSGVMFFGWIFGVFIFLLIIAGIYWFFKNANPNPERKR